MIVTYLTDDDVIVSVKHMGATNRGVEEWQVCVEGMGGMARWAVPDLPVGPGWSTEQVARHALQWAQLLPNASACDCGDPDCDAATPPPAREVFGPSSPTEVGLTGPFLDREDAIDAVQIRAGILDAEAVENDRPTIAEMLMQMDGKPMRKRSSEPSDPHNGSTWKLG